MFGIPRSALLLGLAGVIPFAWGVLTMVSPLIGQWSAQTLGPRLVGPFLQLQYGIVILAFMSGVLWGFATKTEGSAAATGYGLSVLPALWAFFMVGNGAQAAATSLAIGFIGLLALDWQFSLWDLTPTWWLKLRLLLTSLVIICLVPVMI